MAAVKLGFASPYAQDLLSRFKFKAALVTSKSPAGACSSIAVLKSGSAPAQEGRDRPYRWHLILSVMVIPIVVIMPFQRSLVSYEASSGSADTVTGEWVVIVNIAVGVPAGKFQRAIRFSCRWRIGCQLITIPGPLPCDIVRLQ